MVPILLIITIPALLGIVVAKPKWGSFLVWPILFTYPHAWWFYHQYLPLSIGFDDLFCVFLFLSVLIRRNILGSVPIRFGYAFWTISAFVVIALIANLAGSRDVSPLERISCLKDMLKLAVYWSLFYAILHCIDDERDLKIQLFMFSTAALLGATIVILQYYFPYQTEIFGAPITPTGKPPVGYGGRMTGSFMNPNAAASVLGCSLMLVITAMRVLKTKILKTIAYATIFVLLVGILVTQSRSGLIALSGGLLLMAIFGRDRKTTWLVIGAAIIVSLALPAARQVFQKRVLEAYEPTTRVVGGSIAGRLKTWSSYFETATPSIYLLGQGFRQGIIRNGMESHNTYVSLITVYGIGGAIWAVAALIVFFRKALILRNFPDVLISTVSAGCMWALLVWGIYAMAADALNASYSRYLLFYLVVLLDRTYHTASHQLEPTYYGEETNQLLLYPEGVEVY